MKELEYIPDNNHLTLTDRVAIEVGLAREESFTKIAKKQYNRTSWYRFTGGTKICSNGAREKRETTAWNDSRAVHELCGGSFVREVYNQ